MARRYPWNHRPTRSSLTWSKPEITDLKEMADAGVPLRVMARALHRSQEAVKSFVRKHGAKHNVRLPKTLQRPKQQKTRKKNQ